MWIGYFQEFPDYLTQGESVLELEENLRDLYRDLTSGEVPGIGKSRNYRSDEKCGSDPDTGTSRMQIHPARGKP